jgi:hypothetical protein
MEADPTDDGHHPVRFPPAPTLGRGHHHDMHTRPQRYTDGDAVAAPDGRGRAGVGADSAPSSPSSPTTEPSPEALALLATLERTAPRASTACAGWTAHELVAHLAAGAAEMATLTESSLAGRPPRATKGFAEREAPFAALDDDRLRARLVDEALRLGRAVDDLRRSRGSVVFSGRTLRACDLELHGRSEAALHRWDLAGDDDVSFELLPQPELTDHAVTTLNAMVEHSAEDVSTRARHAGLAGGRMAFASPGRPDVVLVVDADGARLELDEPGPRPTAVADAATRLLALWGRRSSRRVAWPDIGDEAAGLARFLWGRAARPGTAPSETR